MRHTKSSDASIATETRTVKEMLERSLPEPLPEDLANLKLPPRPFEIDDDSPSSIGEGKIRMAFDHDFEFPRDVKSTVAAVDAEPRDKTPSPPPRPELPTTTTMPTGMSTNFGAMNLEHNAWADDEEEFSKEKEMSMTFE